MNRGESRYVVILSCWLLAALFLMNLFSGELTARLSVSTPPIQIEFIQEIVNNPALVAATASGFIIHSIIKEAPPGTLYYQLLRKMEDQNGLIPIGEMLSEDPFSRCASGEAVIFLPESLIEVVLHRLYSTKPEAYRHVFRFAQERFQTFLPVLLGYPKSMPRSRQESFDRQILWYVSRGIFAHSLRREVANATKCYSSTEIINQQHFKSLTVHEMQGGSYSWLIGLGLGLLTFMIQWALRGIPRLHIVRVHPA